ncbi:MAG: hypothetical protein VCC04_03240, partial [Myxococcota bacterium]
VEMQVDEARRERQAFEIDALGFARSLDASGKPLDNAAVANQKRRPLGRVALGIEEFGVFKDTQHATRESISRPKNRPGDGAGHRRDLPSLGTPPTM